VWLDASKTSPYRFFQFFINAEDAVVGNYLRFFTWLSREEIEALDEETAAHPERRAAQRALAREVTALVHGEDEARRAEQAAGALFSGELASLDERSLLDVFAEAPSTVVPREPVGLVDLFVRTGLCKSNSDARRTIDQGGAYVNGQKQAGERDIAPGIDTLHDRYVVLRRGRKDYHLVRFE
jgi:tyrosyl-tRNA synthetase